MSINQYLTKAMIVLFFFLPISRQLYGQVAVLDSKKIMAAIPQLQKADSMVVNEQQHYASQYNKKKELFDSELRMADSLYKMNPEDTITQKKIQYVQQLQKDLKDFETEANRKIDEYRSVLLTPYYDKANAAIKAVAQRLKYRQVIDIQVVPTAWYDPSSDITEFVIRQLAVH